METESFLFTLQQMFKRKIVGDFLLQCLKKMTLVAFSFFLSSINTFLTRLFLPYLVLITTSLITLALAALCLHPLLMSAPFTHTPHSLLSVHPAPVREEGQPEQLPAQCVQPSQHPHRFPQPPALCHAERGRGSHSCCPHPASARPAPSGPHRWHPHPAEEARPL